MSIKDWLENERPREKLLTKGATTLSDAELLALLFGHGTRGKDAISLARELLDACGTTHGLTSLQRAQFCKIAGLGPAKYAQLQASFELSRRAFFAELKQLPELSSAQQTKDYLIAQLGQYRQEVFAVLLLDAQYRLLSYQEISKGSVSRTMIYPGEVVKLALTHHASALIVSHNHPSGLLTPSEEDQKLTKSLGKALALVDIQLLDHIIVAGSRALSFAEQGLWP